MAVPYLVELLIYIALFEVYGGRASFQRPPLLNASKFSGPLQVFFLARNLFVLVSSNISFDSSIILDCL